MAVIPVFNSTPEVWHCRRLECMRTLQMMTWVPLVQGQSQHVILSLGPKVFCAHIEYSRSRPIIGPSQV